MLLLNETHAHISLDFGMLGICLLSLIREVPAESSLSAVIQRRGD